MRSDACRVTGRELGTFEIDDLKFTLAAETFSSVGIGDIVGQVKGDARKHLGRMVRRTMRDKRVDTMILPIGSGLLLCRKI